MTRAQLALVAINARRHYAAERTPVWNPSLAGWYILERDALGPYFSRAYFADWLRVALRGKRSKAQQAAIRNATYNDPTAWELAPRVAYGNYFKHAYTINLMKAL